LFFYEIFFVFFPIENLQHSITVDPLPKQLSSPNSSIDIPTVSQPLAAVNDDRDQLLNSIKDFTVSKLKKTETNDRSTPIFK
jgi:hypothetical protein